MSYILIKIPVSNGWLARVLVRLIPYKTSLYTIKPKYCIDLDPSEYIIK